MKSSKHLIVLLLSLAFIFISMYFTFEEKNIFWHLYTFTLLVGIAISILFGKFKDELPTWKYILFGIGFGTITYGVVRLSYILLKTVDHGSVKTIRKFLKLMVQIIFGIIYCSSLLSLSVKKCFGAAIFSMLSNNTSRQSFHAS